MSGKDQPNSRIWINNSVCTELQWLATHIENSRGIRMLESEEWGPDDAELVLYTDACLTGMGFWLKSEGVVLGYQYQICDELKKPIFFFEALTVVSAILYAIKFSNPPPQRVFIFTDNSNTVDMFNSLKAKQEYNCLLITAVGHVLDAGIQFRVGHIPSELNSITDALSRFDNDKVYRLSPTMTIAPFQPPHSLLGAEQK
jgi:hypothetical protein